MIDNWIEQLTDPSPQVRQQAIDALAASGTAAVPALLEFIRRHYGAPRERALQALRVIDWDAAEAVRHQDLRRTHSRFLPGPQLVETPFDDEERLQFGLVDPGEVIRTSNGEVTTPDLMDHATGRPHAHGLFSEDIFGALDDPDGQRRRRFGHIVLAAPVLHPFLRSASADLLGIDRRDLKQLLDRKAYFIREYYPARTAIEPDMPGVKPLATDMTGIEAVRFLLENLDLVKRKEAVAGYWIDDESESPEPLQQVQRRFRRIHLLRAIVANETRLERMILTVLPVLPAGMRNRGRHARILTRRYQQVLVCNNRLRTHLEEKASPAILARDERRLGQSVARLFDELCGRRLRPREPRMRAGLGATVVPDPSLKPDQCGLPDCFAWDLLRDATWKRLQEHGFLAEEADELIRTRDDDAWDALREVAAEHAILLSWAPISRLAHLQGLRAVLVSGNVLRVHPSLLDSANGTFDGRSVSFLLLSTPEAVQEATAKLPPSQLSHKPDDTRDLLPADVVLGCAYMTVDPLEPFIAPDGKIDARIKDYRAKAPENLKGEGTTFFAPEEVIMAYSLNSVGIHARVRLRLPYDKRIVRLRNGRKDQFEEVPRRWEPVWTTVGRVLLNALLPESMAYYDFSLTRELLCRILSECRLLLSKDEWNAVLGRVFKVGFEQLTRGGMSLGTEDMRAPADKTKTLQETEARLASVSRQFSRGLITDLERYSKTIDFWTSASNQINNSLMQDLLETHDSGVPVVNPLYLMASSGARSGHRELSQLAGCFGLVAKANGQVIEFPVKGNYREGLNVAEFFLVASSAKRQLADRAGRNMEALRVAKQLAGLARPVVITEEDCGSISGIAVARPEFDSRRSIAELIEGRVSAQDIVDPDGTVIVRRNEVISASAAARMASLGMAKHFVRSPLTCQAHRGVCRQCYGTNPATGELIEEGVSPGAAVAIECGFASAEPVWNTFHICRGVGYQRFQTLSCRTSGTVQLHNVTIGKNEEGESIVVGFGGEVRIGWYEKTLESHPLEEGTILLVADGDHVYSGTKLAQREKERGLLIARHAGRVRYADLEPSIGRDSFVGDPRLIPRLVITDDAGRILDTRYLWKGVAIRVKDGQFVTPGITLAEYWPQPPPVTADLFKILEFNDLNWRAILAEIDGYVTSNERVQGGWNITLQPKPAGAAVGEAVVHFGKIDPLGIAQARAGECLSYGNIDARDLLRICGVETAQRFLLEKLEALERRRLLRVDHRHFEVLLSQMFRWIEIAVSGDTPLAPGQVLDKSLFHAINRRARIAGQNITVGETRLLGLSSATRLLRGEWRTLRGRELCVWLAEAALVGHREMI